MFGNPFKGKNQREKRESLQALESVVLEITQACPLRCIGCYVPHDPIQLSLHDLELIVNKIPLTDALNFSGGEPFSHPDLDKCVIAANSAGHDVTVFSSGTVHHEKLDWLVGNINALRVTLKYANAELDAYWRNEGANFNAKGDYMGDVSGNGYRVPDSFELTSAFITKAVDLGIDTYVHIVVDEVSAGFVKDTIAYVENLGATPILLPFIDFDGNLPMYMSSFNAFKNLTKKLVHERSIEESQVEMVESMCIAGVKRCAINVKGEVRPCVYIGDEAIVGNILTEDWNTIHKRLKDWRGGIGLYRGRCPAFDSKLTGE